MSGGDDFVARLRRLDCCSLSDALDALGLDGVVTGVPQAAASRRIAGRAVTLKVGPGSPPPGPQRHLGTAAIESGDADSVLVIEQSSGVDAGCWGGLLTLAAAARGIAGAIADGPVRDIDEAIEQDWPIFTRKTTCRTARGRVVELGTNVPVTFEGLSVAPGDYVAADRSGIVVIRPGDIDRVLGAAEAIVARETAIAAAVRAGTPAAQAMAGNYETMLKDLR